jgi:hypothetical protein
MDAATMINLLNGLNQTKSENSASKIDPSGLFGMLNTISASQNGASAQSGDMMKILESADKNGVMKNMPGILNILPGLMNSKAAAKPSRPQSQSQNNDQKQGAVMKNNEYDSYNANGGRSVRRASPLRRNGYTDQSQAPNPNPEQNQYQDPSANRQNPPQHQGVSQYPDEKSQSDEKNRGEATADYSDLQYVNTAPKYKSTRKRNNIRYTGK